jgi:hypothetical protein
MLPKPLYQEELEKITAVEDVLKRDLLAPHKEVLAEYVKYGQQYERNGRDRTYERFYAEVYGKETLRNQPIAQSIANMSRHKDGNGEWLTYQMGLAGRNWKGNKVEYWYDQGGKIEGMPEFHVEVDPQTDQVVSGTMQINELKTIYTIPFSKEKVIELEPFLSETCGFSVKDRSGRRQSCNSLSEFRDMDYEDLVNLKTGFTDYIRNKQQLVGIGGGVR